MIVNGRNIEPLTDFDADGIIIEIRETGLLNEKALEKELAKMNEIIRELGTFDHMATHDRNDILMRARRAVNTFEKNYRRIVLDSSLGVYRSDFRLLSGALRDAGVIDRGFDIPDWDVYNETLMSAKLDNLHYFIQRPIFTLNNRMTLFEIQGKKELQSDIIQYIAESRGGMTHDAMLDTVTEMIDRKYPNGKIPVPYQYKDKEGHNVMGMRYITTDYYAETWIRDVESSIHSDVMRATYLQAGIDLVMVESGEAEDCAICSPDVGKIFSLTGADPDFRRMDFSLPRHPGCDCYIVPVEDDGGATRAGTGEKIPYTRVNAGDED